MVRYNGWMDLVSKGNGTKVNLKAAFMCGLMGLSILALSTCKLKTWKVMAS